MELLGCESQRYSLACNGIAEAMQREEKQRIAKAWRRKDMKCGGKAKRRGVRHSYGKEEKCIESVTVH